jgi:hypothetical protein
VVALQWVNHDSSLEDAVFKDIHGQESYLEQWFSLPQAMIVPQIVCINMQLRWRQRS